MKIKSLITCILLLFTSSCGYLPHKNADYHCIKSRTALDIGSGSTKVLTAKINSCKRKLIKVIASSGTPLKFKEALHLNSGRIPEKLYQQLKAYIVQLKEGPIVGEMRGVATEVFRQAKNGKAIISRLKRETGVSVEVIDQKREAELGFWGAVAISGKDPNKVVVWDIGGGSMQITTRRKDHFFSYLGKLASVSFKNKVLSHMNKKRGSPNPLGKYNRLWAEKMAEEEAKKIDIEVIQDIQRKELLGIGGVHYYSVRNQLKLNPNTPVSRFQLERVIDKRQFYSDSKLFGEYKETEVTNLILVKSFLKALKVETILPVKVNLATGLIFDETAW